VKMVVAKCISISNISLVVGKSLVCRFNGKAPGEKSLSKWLDLQWKPKLGYSLEFQLLAKGWVSFLFQSAEDCDSVLKKNWFWGQSGLTLKPWTVDFDPMKEITTLIKV